VTDAGLKELGEMKRLAEVVLIDTKVTDGGVNQLQIALPTCAITQVLLKNKR
jgi:hypothetical protein